MSNTLYITVMEFRPVSKGDEPSFGFTAWDSYASEYQHGWPTFADMLQDIPNAEALQALVLNTEAFNSFVVGESGNIIIDFPA